jgi:SpoVK/Ycf46/Vps4 family AAA+-type ATPase
VTENIYSKWLGESGQNMKNAIALAEKMSPAIVFVDEIDRFGKRQGSSAGSAEEETQRVFSQFLEWLGRPDREAIIVGTTNVPEHLDDAFLRAGRFDYKIPFLYPGPQARLEILLVHLGFTHGGRRGRVPISMSDEEVRRFLEEAIVPSTGNFSCAELEELVTRAKRVAFDKERDALSGDDLLTAAKTFRIDSANRKRTIQACMVQARHFTDDQTFLDSVEEEMGARERESDEAAGAP